MKHASLLLIALVLATQAVPAHEDWVGARPDGHAPYGVMGDHMHRSGEWMLAYRYVHTEMRELRHGTADLSPDQVLANYMMSPLSMTMDAHMVGGMYAPTDYLTLTLMLPWLEKEMTSRNGMGMRRTTRTDGLGDLRVTGLVRLFETARHRAHLNLGLSLPTGSIDEKENGQRLAYPLQLGSGTFDLVPGVTYFGQCPRWSWGAQALGVIRMDENDHDYRLGNRLQATGWLAYKWCDWFSTSARLEGQVWGNIHGADPALNPMSSPGADPDAKAGEQVNLLLGANFYVPQGRLKSHRLAIEAGRPVYQRLDGPQLKLDWLVTAGWQWSF